MQHHTPRLLEKSDSAIRIHICIKERFGGTLNPRPKNRGLGSYQRETRRIVTAYGKFVQQPDSS
jgi:hypothetical protein